MTMTRASSETTAAPSVRMTREPSSSAWSFRNPTKSDRRSTLSGAAAQVKSTTTATAKMISRASNTMARRLAMSILPSSGLLAVPAVLTGRRDAGQVSPEALLHFTAPPQAHGHNPLAQVGAGVCEHPDVVVGQALTEKAGSGGARRFQERGHDAPFTTPLEAGAG